MWSESGRPRRGLLGLGALLSAAALLFACDGGTVETSAASGPSLLDSGLVATAEQLRQQASGGTMAYEVVSSLTLEVGPRLAGSAGDRAAVRWAEDKMRQLGLANVRRQTVMVPHWERGAETGAVIRPYPQPVVLTALGGSVATPATGLQAPVFGVESLEALEEVDPAQVAGKIVFFDGGRMEGRQDARGYGPAVQPRVRGAAAAAAKGAVAVLIRSAGSSTSRVAHTGTNRYQDGVPRIPAAALSNSDADMLSRQLATGQEVIFDLLLETREYPPAESANVIGEVVGRERPEEVILLAAHLDSWDLGTGAHDDGAGCAVVLTTAHLLAGLPQPPRRTVRVVLFANEEFGLSGARAYAEAHAGEMELHKAAMESDLGAGKVWAFRSRVADELLPLARSLGQLVAPLGVEDAGNNAFGGADLSPLAPHGVPFFDLAPDATRYFDWHHTVDDTLDKIVATDLDQAVAAFAAVTYALAEMPQDLGRAPVPEGLRR